MVFQLDVRRVLWPCDNTGQLELGILIHRTEDKIGGRLHFPRRTPEGGWICEVMHVYPGQRARIEKNVLWEHLTWCKEADLSTEPRVAEKISRYTRAITESDEAKVTGSWPWDVEAAISLPWDPHAGQNRGQGTDGPGFMVSQVSRGSGTSTEWGFYFHKVDEELGTLVHLEEDRFSGKLKSTEKPGCLLHDWDEKKPIVGLYASQLGPALNLAVATSVVCTEKNSRNYIDWYTKFKAALVDYVLDKDPIELQQKRD